MHMDTHMLFVSGIWDTWEEFCMPQSQKENWYCSGISAIQGATYPQIDIGYNPDRMPSIEVAWRDYPTKAYDRF